MLAGSSDNEHEPRCPSQLHCCELVAAFDLVDQRRHPRRVAFWPVYLRQQIIDHIHTTRTKERQRLVKVIELSRPRIRIDQVELSWLALSEKLRSVDEMKRDPAIATKMSLSHGSNAFIRVDGVETRRAIHPIQEPGRAVTRSSAQFQEPTRWL